MFDAMFVLARRARPSLKRRAPGSALAGGLTALVIALALPAAAIAASSEVNTGPVHGRIVGQSYYPIANKNWSFTVTVTKADGKALSGTVEIEFTAPALGFKKPVGYDGGKGQAKATHAFTHGRWHETLTFPAQAEGEPLMVQAVVRTKSGSITLDWPIVVKA